MRKPSMFSKDYNRKMKIRRIKLIIIIGALIVIISGIIYKTELSSLGTSIKESMAFLFGKGDITQIEEQNQNNEDLEDNDTNELNKLDIDEKEIEIKLSNNKVAKAIIINDNGKSFFKDIIIDKDYGMAEISPNKEVLIINDLLSQEIIMYKSDGSSENITKSEYTTRKGKSFSRESVIQSNNGFQWCNNPRFMDDSHIIYISNLPYIGSGDLEKYIWIIDLNSKEHKIMWDLKGKNITFGELTNNGLQVNIDGKNIYMNQSSLV